MNLRIPNIVRLLSLNTLRLLLVSVGVWLAAVEPANHWAEARQVANVASGHVPEMDPGVVVVLAAMFALMILGAVLLVELIRCALGGKALSLPSCLALGAVAACPVGYTFGFAAPVSNAVMYLASALLLAAFYAVRWAWLHARPA